VIYNLFSNKSERLKSQSLDLFLLTTNEHTKHSLEELLTDEQELYSPALITNAVANLCAFKNITFESLYSAENQNANAIFNKGAAAACSYELRGNALILGSTLQSLSRLEVENYRALIKRLESHKDGSLFDALEGCEATLLFVSGFLFEASRRFMLILGGDILMAFALVIADLLREELLMRPMSNNITYITTKWALQTQPIEETLKSLSYTPNALYSSFSIDDFEIKELKNIGKNERVESSASAAALAYAAANAIKEKAIIDAMELIVYMR